MHLFSHVIGNVKMFIQFLKLDKASGFEYHNNPRYWDRQVFANGADPDQTPQNEGLIRVYPIRHIDSNILDM